MQYLLTPMSDHPDNGFGLLGDAFYEAARAIDSKDTASLAMPSWYLYRHTAELYLKSIVTLFEIRFNSRTTSELLSSLSREHNLQRLYDRFLEVIEANLTWLNENTSSTWDADNGLSDGIAFLSRIDAKSDFFRYPMAKSGLVDPLKEQSRRTSKRKLQQKHSDTRLGFVRVLIIDSLPDGDPLMYEFGDKPDEHLTQVFRRVTHLLSGAHAMTRYELFSGR